jgi:hypothetical protein
LLEHGADPNMPEDSAPNGAALFNACCENHLEVARLLLEHAANPNAGADSSGCCLTIVEVCHGGKAKPLKRLLRQHGASNPPYAMDVPAMRRAIRERDEVIRHEEFLRCVLAKGDAGLLDSYLDSDPTVPRRVWSGAYPKSPGMIRRLLARGMDPNNPDWLGRTFLHFCAANGDRTNAAVFVRAGADINTRDLESKGTPLGVAVRSYGPAGDPKQAKRGRRMIEFLLKRGAMTNLPGDEPWATPLAWARKRGVADIEQMLLKHGAH